MPLRTNFTLGGSFAHTDANATNTQVNTNTTDIAGKQPLDADLTAIAALSSSSNKVPYATGAGAWALTDFTSTGRAVVGATDAAAVRAAIGAATLHADVYIDYSTHPDGDPPDAMDTGQAVSWLRSNGNQSKMLGGKLVADTASAAGSTYASYSQADGSHDFASAGVAWTVDASDGSTADGVAGLIIWEHTWDNTGSPPKTPAHITFGLIPNGSGYCTAAWFVGDGTHAYHSVKSCNFLAPEDDGVTEWEASVAIDTVNGVGYLYLPGTSYQTGDRFMTLTDAEIAAWFAANAPTETALTLAQYADSCNTLVVEHIGTGAVLTTRYPSYTRAWASYAAPVDDALFGLRMKAGTANLVDLSSTQTLTNKTISGAGAVLFAYDNNISFVDAADATKIAKLNVPSGQTASTTRTHTLPLTTTTLVGTDTTDTLTNKTVNLSSNTLTGTTAQFNTALSDGDFATLAGTETLTNKTISGGGSLIFVLDTKLTFCDSVDATKVARFDVPTGQTTGTTRVHTLPAVTSTLASLDGTETLTGKRVTPRINSTASSATPSINTDTTDQFNITALAAAITSMTTNLTGTPTDGQKLLIRIKDDGTARAITWGSSFVSSGSATLLATTVVSKTHMVNLIYDSAAVKWVCQSCDASGY